MNRLLNPLLKKINRTNKASISMRLRLFFFLMILVLTMAGGIIIILLVTGTFTAGITESRRLIKNELQHASNNISMQYGQLSLQAVSFSNDISQRINDKLKEQNLTFSQLSQHPKQLEQLLSDLFENTYYSLQKCKGSGAFVILDTTVNPSLVNANQSKVGLYLKNMEPNVISASNPTFTLLRGFSSIGRNNSINLHTQWSMEFDISNADYYIQPILAAKNNISLPLSKLYYWSIPQIIPGTSEDVMLCSVPILDSNHNIYGVCGFEVSAMLFKLLHMPDNSTYSRMFCMFSPYQNSRVEINHSLFAGGYSMRDFSKKDVTLIVKEHHTSFDDYNIKDSVYLGYHKPIQLYPDGSSFSEDIWITAILLPKEDIVNSITLINVVLACLLCMLVVMGIIISVIFSNKYLKPISQGIRAIKLGSEEDLPKTNVQEIDDLIYYLSDYKKELNRKIEQDKYQITKLENFINNTKTLTPAERSVFNHLINGLSAKEIADTMFLSINTIKTHNKRIFVKLEIASREELLLYISMLKEIGLELI